MSSSSVVLLDLGTVLGVRSGGSSRSKKDVYWETRVFLQKLKHNVKDVDSILGQIDVYWRLSNGVTFFVRLLVKPSIVSCVQRQINILQQEVS